MRISVILALVPAVAVAAARARRAEPAPLRVPDVDEESLVANKYIVKLIEGSSLTSADDGPFSILSNAPDHIYGSIFNGFSATLDDETLAALRDHPDVEFIEQDALVSGAAFVTQANAPWGLRRISKRANTGTSYTYDSSAGSGTCSYILDSGVDVTHPDFGGRASSLIAYAGGSDKDDSGHGTHIAGIIGSATYGVAKNTRLYSVKVLDRNNEGTVSNVIAGLDFITADAPTRNCPNGSFVNMSFLARGVSSIVDAACERVVAAGVFLAVAAGNEYKDVYYYSPARLASVCTVAATGSDDAIASWSNYGAYVNVLAPGADITSLAVGGGSRVASGTSMATGHVVGLAAYLAALEGNPGPTALCNRIAALATTGIVTNLRQEAIPSLMTPNRLAFNGNPSG